MTDEGYSRGFRLEVNNNNQAPEDASSKFSAEVQKDWQRHNQSEITAANPVDEYKTLDNNAPELHIQSGDPDQNGDHPIDIYRDRNPTPQDADAAPKPIKTDWCGTGKLEPNIDPFNRTKKQM